MVNTNLEQFTVADFVDWDEQKRLKLNPYFQRNSVWTPAAKSYLIDSILCGMPVPKIYLRSSIDLLSRKTIREVVDGQQRVRTILGFANNAFKLSTRSKEYAGQSFDSLDDELKHRFLSYSLSVDQLLNASDEDVLEVFSRLNSYSVRLNPAELRHAEFQGELKWGIVELSKENVSLWQDYGILSLARRARMQDYQLVAEMCQILIQGVVNGGQPRIKKFYSDFDREDFNKEALKARFNDQIQFMTNLFGEAISGTIARPPHFLMLFAATAFLKDGIERGEVGKEIDEIDVTGFAGKDEIISNLVYLGELISGEQDPTQELRKFVEKSSSSTQGIASRKVRFPVFVRALQGEFK